MVEYMGYSFVKTNIKLIKTFRMKNLFKTAFLFTLLFSIHSCKEKPPEVIGDVAPTEGKEYKVGPDFARIYWEASKPNGTHNGTITLSEGSLYASNGKITSGNFIIDMSSIQVADLTGEEKANLEAHLKGTETESAQDFFNTTKYPTGKFEITSVQDSVFKDGSNFFFKGNLTLLDKTKEVAIPANVIFNEGSITVMSSTFTINRTDWGITYKSKNIFKELGDKFINDDIVLKLKVETQAGPGEEKK